MVTENNHQNDGVSLIVNSHLETEEKNEDSTHLESLPTDVFWYLKKGEVKISYSDKLINFLNENGFRNFRTKTKSIKLIRIVDNILSEVDIFEIKHFVQDFINSLAELVPYQPIDQDAGNGKITELKREDILSAVIKGSNVYFSKSNLEFLPLFDEPLLNHTKESAYFYFTNGFVEVKKDGYELKPYSELPEVIWDHEILPREFKRLVPFPPDLLKNHPNSPAEAKYNFIDFIWRVSGGKKNRFDALMTIIGYQLHQYFDYTMKAVSLTDTTISETNEANGRSGKTIIGKAIGKMQNTDKDSTIQVEINGKDFNITYPHRYAQCSTHTRHIHLNDLDMEHRKFDFKALYSDITEGLAVNHKRGAQFSQKVKILISSNKVIPGSGNSHRARLNEFEVSDFFHPENEVDKFYGDWFWTNWDEAQWSAFDNFMIACVRLFLEKGMLEADNHNLEERRFREATCPEFAEFCEENLVIGREYTRKELLEEFIEMNPDFERKNWFGTGKLLKWLRDYEKYKGYKMEERKSGKDRFVKIVQK